MKTEPGIEAVAGVEAEAVAGKKSAAALLGMLARHDDLQRERSETQSALPERSAEEKRLLAAFTTASQTLGAQEDRIAAARAMDDHEAAATLDTAAHKQRKMVEATSKALEKYRAETRAAHAKMAQQQEDAEVLLRAINVDLRGMNERDILGPIDGRLRDIEKSIGESVERNWKSIERELVTLRPIIAAWERANGRESQWVQVIASGRSVTARRCLDEGVGFPVGVILGRRRG
jgi:hypothetical protein